MFRAIVVFLLVSMVAFSTAQLNFSTGWGKRAMNTQSSNENNCKSAVDSVMMIYKLIQNEAQKIVECEHFSK